MSAERIEGFNRRLTQINAEISKDQKGASAAHQVKKGMLLYNQVKWEVILSVSSNHLEIVSGSVF